MNTPAFPIERPTGLDGLTKLEYASIKMLQSLIANYEREAKVNTCYIANTEYPVLCNHAIALATELFKQLDENH